MAKFSEKNAHLFEGDKTDADVEYLKRLYDIAVPKIAQLNSPEGFDVIAVYKPDELINDGRKDGRLGTTGSATAFARRHSDDNVLFYENFSNENWSEINALSANDVLQLISADGAGIALDGLERLGKIDFAKNSPSGGHIDVAKGLSDLGSPVRGAVGLLFDKENLAEFGVGDNSESLKGALESYTLMQYEKAINLVSTPRNQKLTALGVNVAKYSESQLNYLSAGDSADKIKRRNQFLDAVVNILGAEGQEKHADTAIKVMVGEINGETLNHTLTAVDNGEPFMPHLAVDMGVPNITQKEMRRAGEILWKNTQNKSGSPLQLDTKRAFAIAKLPSKWFVNSSGSDALSPNVIDFTSAAGESTVLQVIEHAERLGLALDEMKGFHTVAKIVVQT
jgi:hypothetical protein